MHHHLLNVVLYCPLQHTVCNVAIHCSILFGVSAYCPGPFSMLSWTLQHAVLDLSHAVPDLSACCPGPFSMLSRTFQHAVLDPSACCLGPFTCCPGPFSMLSRTFQHAVPDLSACCPGPFMCWTFQHALCNTVNCSMLFGCCRLMPTPLVRNMSAPLRPVHRNLTVGRTPTTRLGHCIL